MRKVTRGQIDEAVTTACNFDRLQTRSAHALIGTTLTVGGDEL